jgi:outer membrane protein assembly factor BamB
MIRFPTLRSNGLNIRQLLARHRLWGAAILCVLLIAGCGPAPLGTGWPAISLLTSTCGETTSENIVLAFNDRIVMVNPADGKGSILYNRADDCKARTDAEGKPRVWDFRGGGPNLFFSTPLKLDDETLLTVGYNQHVFKIDMLRAEADVAAGTPIPDLTGHTVADVVQNGDLLYLGLSSKNLVALHSDDYSVAWMVNTEHGVWSKPLIHENTIYFTSLDHSLYAADAQTGDLRWKLDLEGAAISTPLYDETTGHLFVGSFARKIFEISLDGQVVNQYATEDWVWGTPVIVDGTLYAADLVGNVYALDTTNNLAEVWKQKVAARAIRATPLVTGDMVIVASRDQKLYWLNRADGTVKNDSEGQPLVRDVQAEILSDVLLVQPSNSLKIDEPYIVVSTLAPDKALVAYSLSRAEQKWAYALQ